MLSKSINLGSYPSTPTMGYVYIIKNTINDKVYVGKTETTLKQRFSEHKQDSVRRRNEKRPLYAAMRKYGVENFYIELIEETDDTTNREVYWIDQYDSFKHGYNATRGGDGSCYLDRDEIVAEFKRTKCVADVCKKLHHDRGHVAKILRQLGFEIDDHKISLFRNGIYIGQFDSKTNQLLKIFPSIKSAAKALGEVTKAPHIRECVKGKIKSAYNYYWKNMESSELLNAPGIIITLDSVSRTTKVKKFIEKNKISDYKIIYLDPIPDDFRLVEKELKKLENKIKGIETVEKTIVDQPYVREAPYKYRLNVNTILSAYNEKDLEELKKRYGVYN